MSRKPALNRYDALGKEKKLVKTKCISSAVNSSLCDAFAFCTAFSHPSPPLPSFYTALIIHLLQAGIKCCADLRTSMPRTVLTCCGFSALFFSSVVAHASSRKLHCAIVVSFPSIVLFVEGLT